MNNLPPLRGKQKVIYRLIQEAGEKGINANDLRRTTYTVDVPKVVSELNKKGYSIFSKREKDGTATYSLTTLPQKPRTYIFEGNRAIPVY